MGTWIKKSSGDGSIVSTSSNNGHLNVNGADVTVYDDTTLKNQAHTHSNKSTLDKFGESSGTPTFNGVVIGGGSGSYPTEVINYYNLFDKTQVISGSYHDSSTGNIISGGQETQRIDVIPGYTYNFNRGDSIASNYSFYDSNGVYISGGSAISAKAPSNAKYLYVRIFSSSMIDKFMVTGSYRFNSVTDYVPYSQTTILMNPAQGLYRSKWFNKRWLVLGDSISTGIGDGEGASNTYASNPYHYNLSRQRFIKVHNMAVSGYTIANIYNNILSGVMPPTANAPDLITIMAGTNDHGFNTGMGTINDATTVVSFYGTYKKVIEFLRSQYPLATIGLITPIQRYNVGGTDGNVANAAGYTLRQYCDAVVAIANYYSLPYLDWYNNLGFTPYNTNDYVNFFCPDGGTHPNNAGHIRMAARVGDFIERI